MSYKVYSKFGNIIVVGGKGHDYKAYKAVEKKFGGTLDYRATERPINYWHIEPSGKYKQSR